jgi:carbon monoxide dehydrogenase subunit G
MKISGSSLVALPPERAYQVMQDPVVLARCIPGCDALEKIAENEYRMKMKMSMASLSGRVRRQGADHRAIAAR